MYPTLISIGPVTLYTYGLLLATAFLVAMWRAQVVARQWPDRPVPVAPDEVANLCTLILVGGLVGARAFYVAQHADVFLLYPLEILAIWHGGLIWYGGFAGGILAAGWYIRTKHLSYYRVMDQFVPFVALGHAIGRIGCFFNGCCYGFPTAAWFGVEFPGHPEPVIPTQLFESAFLLLVYAVLRRMQRPSILRHRGMVFWSYLLAYAVFRFLIEFWRGDQHLFIYEWTVQQAISAVIAFCAFGSLLLHVRRYAADLPARCRSR